MKRIMIVMAAMALAGCSNSAKETLGLKREAPDEFRVIARPPLSIPPNFTLRPPLDDEDAVQKDSITEAARQTLVTEGGETVSGVPVPRVTENAAVSPAERGFLNNIGAGQANPAIKQILREENQGLSEEEKEERSLWGKITRKGEKNTKPDPIVDAKKESERIKENKQQNKPVTAGETPTVEQKPKGILQRIFSRN